MMEKPLKVGEAKERAAKRVKTSDDDYRILTFCKEIDKIVNIEFGEILEICGEAGVGKTQLAMQLAINATVPKLFCGPEGEVLIIDTEGGISGIRLGEIAEALVEYFSSFVNETLINYSINSILTKIYIKRITTPTKLLEFSTKLIGLLEKRRNVKVLIIDSVTFHFRYGFEYNKISERNTAVKSLAETLDYLAVRYDLAIICVNQVTTGFTHETSFIKPALGKLWNSFVSKRLMISRTGVKLTSEHIYSVEKRVVEVEDTQQKAEFMIVKEGIRSIK